MTTTHSDAYRDHLHQDPPSPEERREDDVERYLEAVYGAPLRNAVTSVRSRGPAHAACPARLEWKATLSPLETARAGAAFITERIDSAEQRLGTHVANALTLAFFEEENRAPDSGGDTRDRLLELAEHLESWSQDPEQARAGLQGKAYLERTRHHRQAIPQPAAFHTFQHRVAAWMPKVFDARTIESRLERGLRVLEEALELAQSVGVDQARAERLLAHVMSRPRGETLQEIGGLLVTAAALCNAVGLDMERAAREELERCNQATDKIAAKHQAKVSQGLTAARPA